MLKDKIKRARCDNNLTQAELAKLIGLKPCAIANFESGRRTPGINNLIKLCKGLRVSSDWLLELNYVKR